MDIYKYRRLTLNFTLRRDWECILNYLEVKLIVNNIKYHNVVCSNVIMEIRHK